MMEPKTDKTSAGELEGQDRARYVRALLTDLRALERMFDEDMFESGTTMIGAEQEMFLVDRAFNAAPVALEMMERVADSHFTTELGRFNLEMNADPQPLAGGGLARLETQLGELYAKVQRVAAELAVQPVLTGILPTLARTDLGLDSMVPNPRYLTLNRVMRAAKNNENYDISIKGLDELAVKHDSLMFEACNASFQVHLQATDPDRFGHEYDVAQLVLAPVMALGTNSPTLLGKRLWQETRITLFEQSCDIRTRSLHARQDAPRVSFGRSWATDGGALGLFKENVTRYRPLVGIDSDEDSLALLEQGKVPELRALRLHSGTIYRWNRPVYGISPNGKPHLRIELRVLPSGPSIVDEVANAAFWLGLMKELTATIEGLPQKLDIDHAAANFYAAAREGLAARFMWLDGEEVLAQPFILDRLLPLAESGLRRARVEEADAKRYLGIIEKRVRTLHTGARWALRSLAEMKGPATTGRRPEGPPGEHLTALVAATIARQETGRPVAEWERARLDEIPARRTGYAKVSQYMQTDLVIVHPNDPIEYAADIMSWERVRHLPVEDESGKLVGLVTSRAVLRHFANLPGARTESQIQLPRSDSSTSLVSEIARSHRAASGAAQVVVADVMQRDVVTVSPDTWTLDAIALMRRHRIGCLPVVKDGRIVAMVMEEDFMGIAADLLEERIGSREQP
jgi:CBS domain-containing protein